MASSVTQSQQSSGKALNAEQIVRKAFQRAYALDTAQRSLDASRAYEAAIDSFETHLETQSCPNTALAFARLAAEHGVTLTTLKRNAQAVGAFRRALEIYEEILVGGAGPKLILEISWVLAWSSAAELLLGNLTQALRTISHELRLRNSINTIFPDNAEFRELLSWAEERQAQLLQLRQTHVAH